MREKVVKCPICGLPKGLDCDLMVGKNPKDLTLICCCNRLQEKSVKKQ